MKRFVYSSEADQNVPVIEIVVNMLYNPDFYISAAEVLENEKIHHPVSKKRSKMLSDAKLRVLNNLVSRTLSHLRQHKFQINSIKEEKNSYSMYIDFVPVTSEDKTLQRMFFKFRISDHPMHGGSSNKITIMSFVMNRKNCSNVIELSREIDDVCDRLKEGDLTVLNR